MGKGVIPVTGFATMAFSPLFPGTGMAEPHDLLFDTGPVRPTRNLPSQFTKALRKEAEEGIPTAMLMMGKSSVDIDDGLMWLGKAAEAGVSEAYGVAGLSLLRVDRKGEALTWFQRGELVNEPESLYRLGLFAWAGDGVPQDSFHALTLLQRAVDAGHKEATKALERLKEEVHGGVKADPEEAMHLLKMVPRLHDPDVMLATGRALMVGDKVGVNPVRGMELIRSAAQAGFAEAHFELFRIHTEGGPKLRDLDAAKRHLLISADKGLPEAMEELGLQLCAKHPEEAVAWLRQAANADQPRAMFALGELSYDGNGVPKNKLDALRWFRAAAKLGHKPAASRAAKILFTGDGVLANKVEAKQWADLAGERLGGFWSFIGFKS